MVLPGLLRAHAICLFSWGPPVLPQLPCPLPDDALQQLLTCHMLNRAADRWRQRTLLRTSIHTWLLSLPIGRVVRHRKSSCNRVRRRIRPPSQQAVRYAVPFVTQRSSGGEAQCSWSLAPQRCILHSKGFGFVTGLSASVH